MKFDTRVMHFALHPATDFDFPLSDDAVLTTCLCFKATGELPDNLRELLNDNFDTPLHWFSVDKSDVTCQDCRELLYA